MTTTTEQGTPPREEPDASPVWSREDDERLSLAVARLGHSWEAVAQQLESRFTAEQCSSRWTRSLRPVLDDAAAARAKLVTREEAAATGRPPSPPARPADARPTFRAAEDLALLEALDEGETSWSAVASRLPGRSGEQCRARWHEHLSPLIEAAAAAERRCSAAGGARKRRRPSHEGDGD